MVWKWVIVGFFKNSLALFNAYFSWVIVGLFVFFCFRVIWNLGFVWCEGRLRIWDLMGFFPFKKYIYVVFGGEMGDCGGFAEFPFALHAYFMGDCGVFHFLLLFNACFGT